MFIFKIYSQIKSKKNNQGFALPQILIIGIGIAVGVSGLMAASILGLTGSRINRQELLAKSSSYSGITKLRALFNDNSQGRLFNFFWLVNNCSDKASECESTNISLPSNEYWADDSWCNDEENCRGRQKAPFCSTNKNYSWTEEQQIVRNLFVGSNSPFTNLGAKQPYAANTLWAFIIGKFSPNNTCLLYTSPSPRDRG